LHGKVDGDATAPSAACALDNLDNGHFAAQVIAVVVIESVTLGLIDLARWHDLTSILHAAPS
jgi:hypothetical protein